MPHPQNMEEAHMKTVMDRLRKLGPKSRLSRHSSCGGGGSHSSSFQSTSFVVVVVVVVISNCGGGGGDVAAVVVVMGSQWEFGSSKGEKQLPLLILAHYKTLHRATDLRDVVRTHTHTHSIKPSIPQGAEIFYVFFTNEPII